MRFFGRSAKTIRAVCIREIADETRRQGIEGFVYHVESLGPDFAVKDTEPIRELARLKKNRISYSMGFFARERGADIPEGYFREPIGNIPNPRYTPWSREIIKIKKEVGVALHHPERVLDWSDISLEVWEARNHSAGGKCVACEDGFVYRKIEPDTQNGTRAPCDLCGGKKVISAVELRSHLSPITLGVQWDYSPLDLFLGRPENRLSPDEKKIKNSFDERVKSKGLEVIPDKRLQLHITYYTAK